MKVIIKILKFIYSIYAMLVFTVLMFFVIPFALLSTLFGTKKGGIIIYTACQIWAILWYRLIFYWYREIHLGPHDRKKQYIFVANHRSYLDIPQLMRSMHQPVRVLGKHDLAKVPLFGIIYRSAVVMVDRSSQRNKAKSMLQLRRILQEGISIFIFPEGGFNETGQPLARFFDGAFKMAIETDTPIKPIIFPDNLKRFPPSSLFGMCPGRSRTIYLEEISVHEYGSDGVQALKEKVFVEMQKALENFEK